MRSLITGGRGFVGTWLAAHLRSSGDEVVQIDQEVEITDPAALLAAVKDAAPDAVYHLAALTHVGQSWDEPLRVLEVNVLGTGALLAAARRCGTDPTGAGDQLGRGLRRGHRPGAAPADRGVADRAAHPVRGLQAGRRGPVRPGLAGPRPARRDRPAVQPHRARASRPTSRSRPWPSGSSRPSGPGPTEIPVGNLTARRDFTDVRDVVRAYRLLVESGEPGRGLQRVLRPGRRHRGHRRPPAGPGRQLGPARCPTRR